jgi:hypothetical protein
MKQIYYGLRMLCYCDQALNGGEGSTYFENRLFIFESLEPIILLNVNPSQ